MSKRPGRNDPCPCGSGKKYKRCCLSTDEAVARDQQVLFDHEMFGDADLDADDDGEAFLDIEDAPILDVRDITRVCYTRGFVSEVPELRFVREAVVA
jgi:hypothetical protein